METSRGNVLVGNIIDGEKYPDKVELAKQVILSEKSIEIDNSWLHKGLEGTSSPYYVGWAGALAKASEKPTKFYIPNKFEVIESSRGEGDITIHLTNTRNGDGYSGYTNSIADDSYNQILKSSITIYEVDKLSNAQFETMLRYEFGHALGLVHPTAPDLMAPTITPNHLPMSVLYHMRGILDNLLDNMQDISYKKMCWVQSHNPEKPSLLLILLVNF